MFVGLSSVLKEEEEVVQISDHKEGPDEGWGSSEWEKTVHCWRAQGLFSRRGV